MVMTVADFKAQNEKSIMWNNTRYENSLFESIINRKISCFCESSKNHLSPDYHCSKMFKDYIHPVILCKDCKIKEQYFNSINMDIISIDLFRKFSAKTRRLFKKFEEVKLNIEKR